MTELMDDETISVLKTVCVAGGARAGFNGDSNIRLDQLVRAGLLVAEDLPYKDVDSTEPVRFYQPTKKGMTMFETLTGRGVA